MVEGIPEFAKTKIDELKSEYFPNNKIVNISRLGGLTNFSFKVDFDNGESYVFRLPGEGTEELVNRYDEKVSTTLACNLGIDSELVMFDADKGTKIMKFVVGETMNDEKLRTDKSIEEVADIFKKLHTSGVDTKVPFDVFDMADGYEKFISANGVELYDDWEDIRKKVMALKARVDKNGTTKAPCHNDSLCENWLHDADRMYLIDWEYAGMNDPYWDLADISIEADYDKEMDEKLLRRYHGGEPDENQKLRFEANKIYLDFLWTLWGKTRVPFDGEPLEEYARNRYERLKKNMVGLV